MVETDPAVEWQLTYGAWIGLFRSSGFVIEDLIELRPGPEVETTYDEFARGRLAARLPGRAHLEGAEGAP